ncbi:MAG: hypothetical protein ACRD2A_05260 [Vicinamibacterales bacterium]
MIGPELAFLFGMLVVFVAVGLGFMMGLAVRPKPPPLPRRCCRGDGDEPPTSPPPDPNGTSRWPDFVPDWMRAGSRVKG